MKRYKNFLFILYFIVLIFGCQSKNQASSALPETAVPTTIPTEPADLPTPQPTNTSPAPTPTSEPTAIPSPTATQTAVPVDWSLVRNGATILYYAGGDLWRTNIDGTNQQPLTEGDMLAVWDLESTEDKWWSGGFMPRPFVSPNGRYIAFTQTGGNLVIVDVSNPFPPRTLSSGSVLMAWSPDSRYLAYGRNTLNLYDTETKRATNLTNTVSRGVHSITWSSDSRFIAFACCFSPPEGEYEGVEYGEIRQFDMESGLIETTGEATLSVGGGASTLCWQEAGYFTVYQEAEQTNHCTQAGSQLFFIAESPDGQQLARMLFSDSEDPLHFHQLTLFDIEKEEVLWHTVLENAANRLAWSLDGRYLLLNYNYPGLSPIWRLLADGTSSPETIIEEAFLIDVIPQWQQ